ncbi:MAG: hypothetical protein BM556_01490 [Bacteriovorax sp. MedPE-SWde]|nr:MAG: hypothetical protein BM556_01490 [Bacteriovorax sp. MedPE-SWde]
MIKIVFLTLLISLTSQVYAKKIIIGVPHDVLNKFQSFMSNREVSDIHSYRGKESNRDVVEVILLLKILNLKKGQYTFLKVDSYNRAIKLIQSGRIDLYANTIWYGDGDRKRMQYTLPVIRNGEFTAGIYVRENSPYLTDPKLNIRNLKFLSNKAWTRDWKTLKNMKVRSVSSTTTWDSIMKMIKAKRSDAIMASFPPNNTLIRYNKDNDLSLYPVPNKRIAIEGSRHWIVSMKSKNSPGLLGKINSGIKKFRKDREFFKAFIQSGFFNERTITWKIINKKDHP